LRGWGRAWDARMSAGRRAAGSHHRAQSPTVCRRCARGRALWSGSRRRG
jgi:hypothetical protein